MLYKKMRIFKISKRTLFGAFFVNWCFVYCLQASQGKIHEKCGSEDSSLSTSSDTSTSGEDCILFRQSFFSEKTSIKKARNKEKKKQKNFIQQQDSLTRFTCSVQKKFAPITDCVDKLQEFFAPRHIKGLTKEEEQALRKTDKNARAIQKGQNISLSKGVHRIHSCCSDKKDKQEKGIQTKMNFGGCCNQYNILEYVETPKIIILPERVTNKSDEDNKK